MILSNHVSLSFTFAIPSLPACPPDAAAIEDCEAALADMPAEEDATSAASAVESAAFVAAASIAGIAMGSMMN